VVKLRKLGLRIVSLEEKKIMLVGPNPNQGERFDVGFC